MVRHEDTDDTNRCRDSTNRSAKFGRHEDASTSDESLARFAADARVAEAVRARTRERWLRHQATEATTLAGACWSLAEAGHPLALTTVVGHTHHGPVVSLGSDFVSLQVTTAREVLVPLAMVTTMAPGGDRCPTGRSPRRGSTFTDSLGHLAADRPEVMIWCVGSTRPISGELVGVGSDVVLVAPREGRIPLLYARVGSLCELSVIASG